MSDEALRAEVERLRARIEEVDNWANGVFAVLQDVLLPLLKAQPELARHLEPRWRSAAEDYERLRAGGSLPEEADMPLEQLEPAKMLYRQLTHSGAWPAREPG